VRKKPKLPRLDLGAKDDEPDDPDLPEIFKRKITSN
jgi:hypothetical protein